MSDEQSFVGSAPFGCIKGPSRAGKTEIPGQLMHSALRALLVAVSLVVVSIGLPACSQGAGEAPVSEAAASPELPVSADEALSADLRKDWEALKDTMMQLGDAMPPDKFTFKPTPELRTFGEQLMHVAGANVGLMGLLDPDVTAPTLPEATEKVEALQALSDSFDFGSDILRGQTSASVQETIEGPGFLGPSTRARIVYRTMSHTWDEYGVMTVYLRLNHIVPPASR